jgi:hypothetical protein
MDWETLAEELADRKPKVKKPPAGRKPAYQR